MNRGSCIDTRHSPGSGIVPQGVRMNFLADAGALGRFFAGSPDDLWGNRMIGGVPAVAGEQPDGGFTPETAPVLTQGLEQVRTQHDIAVLPALAALHVDHVARAI